MNVRMKVNGKNEFQNGAGGYTTNISLVPVADQTSKTQVSGSLTLVTTDQDFADSLSFRDELTVDIEKVTDTANTTNNTTAAG